MAEIIDLSSRLKPATNLLSSHPLEFRRGEWLAGNAVQCTREESERFEAHRQKVIQAQDRPFMSLVPNHFTLDGGCHVTVLHLFRFRHDQDLMHRLYRLAGLMECITKVSSPILRTDLVRRFFKIITEEREQLKVSWKGNVHSFLLPIHPHYYSPNLFRNAVHSASTLKDLLAHIGEQAEIQFGILSQHYTFYVPESFHAK